MGAKSDDERKRVPPGEPEADVLEQNREWVEDEQPHRPVIPPDAPEADVLEQDRPAELDDERDEGGTW